MNTTDADIHWEGPDLSAWEPWTPAQVTKMLRVSSSAWCIVGGWAIELWLGREVRPHGDIEIAAPRCDFVNLRRVFEPRYQLYAAGDGETFALKVDQMIPSSRHQCWIADPSCGSWRLDLMLEPGDPETWVFRRDQRIQEPREKMIGRRGGIPFLKPEGVLLYKAKAAREKDQADFEACLPYLSPAARSWLADSLSLIHPDHPWLEVL